MSAEDGIRDLMAKKGDALERQSATDLSDLLHADFFYIDARGEKLSKWEYVDLFCESGQIRFKSQVIETIEVVDYEDFAVATMIVHDEFDYVGTTISEKFRTLSIFRKVDSNWVWVAGQTMSLAEKDL
jgi:hypothetical protein